MTLVLKWNADFNGTLMTLIGRICADFVLMGRGFCFNGTRMTLIGRMVADFVLIERG